MTITSPKQKPDGTQTETKRIRATHTPKSKDESPDQNHRSQCQLRRPQQSESMRKCKPTHTSQSSEEPRIMKAQVPNQSDEERQKIKEIEMFSDQFQILASMPFMQKSARMEEKFPSSSEYSQSQNQQNNTQTGPAIANGPSQPDGSNPVQGNAPSGLGCGDTRLLYPRH